MGFFSLLFCISFLNSLFSSSFNLSVLSSLFLFCSVFFSTSGFAFSNSLFFSLLFFLFFFYLIYIMLCFLFYLFSDTLLVSSFFLKNRLFSLFLRLFSFHFQGWKEVYSAKTLHIHIFRNQECIVIPSPKK